jgi:signal transduction histidine kinase/outer membrane murein-binding lipoprotein Lpp
VSRFFRSVGARLSLALLLVVAIALGVVYLAVVPSLESRLVNARITQLKTDVQGLAPQAAKPENRADLQDFVDTQSRDIGARVMVFVVSQAPGELTVGSPVYESSLGQSSQDVTNDPIATRAVQANRLATGTVSSGDQRWAEAAAPFLGGTFVLLARDSLASQHGSVHLVQRRVLLSAGFALLIALALGYGGAWAFARRIRRLERAADRIAGGRFDQPVRDSGGDELGDLAAAFDRMRIRLAHLDDVRRAFVANASHELRTPLFSLAGFLELMDDEDVDESTRLEFLDQMREQVTRLTKLTSDLLDLSRLDAGRMSVEREPVDLTSLGEELVEEFAPAARRGGHELELQEQDGAVAMGDELRVLQIGRILVENALLHTQPGTAVRVRTFVRDGSAVLEVEDEGDGIPPGQRDQLFERFYRLGGTRASGSGLGLAIAKELAELMDGRITVESEEGRTAFALWLPLATRRISREIVPALS